MTPEEISAIVKKIFDNIKKKKQEASKPDSIVRPVYTEI